MCGISTLWVANEWAQAYKPLFDASVAAVTYRGPDQAQSVLINIGARYKLYAYHARLQITGGAQQQQPYLNADGTSGLVYNGEIYNANSLAAKYLPNHSWHPDQYGKIAEAELLLALITHCWAIRDEWAAAINGMFALVAWHHQEIWACQDAWQMKPLYTMHLPNDAGVLYCSHPAKLISPHLVSKEAQLQYLLFRYIKPNALGEELALLHPEDVPSVRLARTSQAMLAKEADPNNDAAKLLGQSFSRVAQVLSTHNKQDYTVKAFEAHLVNACISHVCDEYPTGLMLSGGVDSTLLAAFNLETQLISGSAYTAVDQLGPITEDAKFAELASRQYGLPWRPVEVGPELLISHLPQLVSHLELPVADVSGLLTYAVCQAAKQDGLKVMYSGAGADELFGGYNRHQAYYNWQKSGLVKRLGTNLMLRWPLLPWQKILSHQQQYLARIPQANLLERPTLAALMQMQMVWPTDIWKDNLPQVSDTQIDAEPIDQLLNHDRNNYLPNQVLMLTDRASMAAGVEIRLPYLDRELSQWALQFDGATHLQHGPKYLMRRCLNNHHGQAFTNRPKQGFGINLDAWMRAPEAEYLLDLILKQESYLWQTLKHSVTQQMVRDHRSRKANYGLQLFALAVYLLWETKA